MSPRKILLLSCFGFSKSHFGAHVPAVAFCPAAHASEWSDDGLSQVRQRDLLSRKCAATAMSLIICRTRRGGATRRLSRSALLVRGRATGTFPRGRPLRAHRWNRCGRRSRRRARMRSCPVPFAMVRGRIGSAHGCELVLRRLAAAFLTRSPQQLGFAGEVVLDTLALLL